MRSAEILASAPTERDLLIEMVRMCIAEAGYDPNYIQPVDPASGFAFTDISGGIPAVVCWRARELVGIGGPSATSEGSATSATCVSAGARRTAGRCGTASADDHPPPTGPAHSRPVRAHPRSGPTPER